MNGRLPKLHRPIRKGRLRLPSIVSLLACFDLFRFRKASSRICSSTESLQLKPWFNKRFDKWTLWCRKALCWLIHRTCLLLVIVQFLIRWNWFCVGTLVDQCEWYGFNNVALLPNDNIYQQCCVISMISPVNGAFIFRYTPYVVRFLY